MSNLEPGIEMFAPETILKTDEEISNDGDAATVANVTINKDVSAKEDELISMETLRESPVQWPERFPGIDEFLTMSDTPIHTPSRDNTQNFTSADMAKINRKLSSGWPQTGFIHCVLHHFRIGQPDTGAIDWQDQVHAWWDLSTGRAGIQGDDTRKVVGHLWSNGQSEEMNSPNIPFHAILIILQHYITHT